MKKINLFFSAILFCVTLNAQNTITTDTILQLSTCAGGNVLVPFSTTSTFGAGNVFTAQLSNAFGQFTNPINIGSIPINIGFVPATIPANATFGFLYKIRVVASNPATVGTPCPNTLIITQVAQLNQIIVTPNDSICEGDSATLSALVPGGSYVWSTGETTQSITVSQTGNYSVNVTDLLQCETDTSVNITVFQQPCFLNVSEIDAISFSISPNPTSGKFVLNFADNEVILANIHVINALGQSVNSEIRVLYANSFEVNLTEVESGIYFVKIDDGNRFSVQRIVKE
jgi:hypothetical protein